MAFFILHPELVSGSEFISRIYELVEGEKFIVNNSKLITTPSLK
jgi:hypothetical protein